MPLVLAIEPDRRQASQLANLVRTRVGADLVLTETTAQALDAIGNRVPDLVLVPALLAPQDDSALAGALRLIAAAAHVQMLTTPVLSAARPQAQRRGVLARLTGSREEKPAAAGCDPAVFGEQIKAYLAEAAAKHDSMEPEPEPLLETETPPAAETPLAAAPIETPIAAAPDVELSIVEAPAVETPIVETPIVVEAPIVESPVVETPIVVEGPIVESPLVEIPIVVEAPIVEAPVVEIPIVVEAPIVESPLVEIPIVVEAPIVESPLVEIPVVVEAPIVESPLVGLPIVVEAPIVEAPVAEIPIVATPPAEAPIIVHAPEVHAPVVEAPAIDTAIAAVTIEDAPAAAPEPTPVDEEANWLDLPVSSDEDASTAVSDEVLWADEPVASQEPVAAAPGDAELDAASLPCFLRDLGDLAAAAVVDQSHEDVRIPLQTDRAEEVAQAHEEGRPDDLPELWMPLTVGLSASAPALEGVWAEPSPVVEPLFPVVEPPSPVVEPPSPVVEPPSHVEVTAAIAESVAVPAPEPVVVEPAVEPVVVETAIESAVVTAPVVVEETVAAAPVVEPVVPARIAAERVVVKGDVAAPARTPAPTPNTEWLELIESLRQDVERMRVERAQRPAPAPVPVPRREPEVRRATAAVKAPAKAEPSAAAAGVSVRTPKPKKPKPPKPIQDEWGFFDPEQCGFAALLAKLQEITSEELTQ